jgi:hypothetical protein
LITMIRVLEQGSLAGSALTTTHNAFINLQV